MSERDPDLAVTMLAEAVDACFFAGDARAMQRTAQRAGELLQAGASEQARFLAAITRGMALVFAGAGEDGIAAIREAVALAEDSPELREDVQLMPWLVMGPLWLREAEAGRTLLTAAIEGARARAELGVLPWLLDRVARSHAATDAWSTARVQYDEAIALARETGQEVELAAGPRRARVARRAHRPRAGVPRGRRGGAGAVRGAGSRPLRHVGDAGARRARARARPPGRRRGAVRGGRTASRRARHRGPGRCGPPPSSSMRTCDSVAARTPKPSRSGSRRQRARRASRGRWHAPSAAARCSPRTASRRCFDEALALHDLTPDAFERACTQLAYGARLRRGRKRRRAREELRAALDTFAALGAEPWEALAQGELAATGETARRRDASTLDELTPQELHIAQLLAEGRTTREAAAALFLSPKTIEYHLRSIYRKLGVNSRGDLAQALVSR